MKEALRWLNCTLSFTVVRLWYRIPIKTHTHTHIFHTEGKNQAMHSCIKCAFWIAKQLHSIYIYKPKTEQVNEQTLCECYGFAVVELTVECTVIDERAHGSINGHRRCFCCSCCRFCGGFCCCWWRWCISFQCKINFSPFANSTVILQRLRNIATIANGKLFMRFIWPCISLFFAIKQKWIVVLWHCALSIWHSPLLIYFFQLCAAEWAEATARATEHFQFHIYI